MYLYCVIFLLLYNLHFYILGGMGGGGGGGGGGMPGGFGGMPGGGGFGGGMREFNINMPSYLRCIFLSHLTIICIFISLAPLTCIADMGGDDDDESDDEMPDLVD